MAMLEGECSLRENSGSRIGRGNFDGFEKDSVGKGELEASISLTPSLSSLRVMNVLQVNWAGSSLLRRASA